MSEKDYKDKNIVSFSRLDVLCSHTIDPPIFPCELCHSLECKGEGRCEGFGAYSLCISMTGL